MRPACRTAMGQKPCCERLGGPSPLWSASSPMQATRAARWRLSSPALTWVLEIARRCDRHRFVVLPKRWIVERTLAWISRCRRLARDYERHARKAAAFVRLAMIRLMLRRLSANL